MDRLNLYKLFFQENEKYYADQLIKFENGKKCSFNFWAGFFGPTWFIYKKLYKQALIIFIIILLLGAFSTWIQFLINPTSKLIRVYNIIFIVIPSIIILGYISNNLYIKKSIRVVEKLIKEYGLENNNDLIIQKVKEKGRNDLVNALLFSGLLFITQIILKINH